MAKVNFKQNALSSVRGIWSVLSHPLWSFIALLLALLVSSIIYLSINIGFYGSLLTSPALSLVDKLDVIINVIVAMVQSYFADGTGVLLLIVSLMQGVAIALFIYTARRNRVMDAAVVGRSGFALVFATLGLGCVPCGTSLLVPVMTLLFSSSAPALLGTANTIVLALALILTVYSLYKIGLIAYKYKISEEDV